MICTAKRWREMVTARVSHASPTPPLLPPLLPSTPSKASLPSPHLYTFHISASAQSKMASDPKPPSSLYPQILLSNPDCSSPFLSSTPTSSSLYPTVNASDLAAHHLFPDDDPAAASALPDCVEETVLSVPGAIVNLIDTHYSVELACGALSIVRLRQGDTVLAVLARVGDDVQWPLAKDEAAVKLDESHYFFSLRVPAAVARASPNSSDDDGEGKGGGNYVEVLNYGLTFASKGQDKLLKELDRILESYSSFSVQKVVPGAAAEVLNGSVAKGVTPAEMQAGGAKKEMMEERSAAYWTTLAPNVEEYSGSVAKAIALGSGQLIRGILWCGDVTVDRLKWGNEVLRKRMNPNSNKSEISRDTMKRMKRVKRVTKMSEKVANGVLSGVVRVTGFFTSSVANSKVGKKFFSLLPGEIVLASLDGFGRVCDAVEVSGKNVLSTSSVVTTNLVSHRYGDEAAELTNESLGAAGHALGTAWAVFKIRKGLNPKSVLKPTTLAKSAAKAAAAEAKAKRKK